MRVIRTWGGGVLAAGLLLTAGCSGDGGADSAGEKKPAAPSGAASDPGTGGPDGVEEPFPLEAESLPRDPEAAAELARALMAQPEDFGPGFTAVDDDPDPAVRAELGPDCVWRLAPLPEDMLASLTSSVVLPAEGGEGPVRMSAVVNVHRDARAAEWEMAGTIEDAQRCPRQQLRSDERVEGLLSFGQGYGALNNTGTEDTLSEHGEFHSETLGGPYYFGWSRARIGPVTVAVSARGAPGWDQQELTGVMTQAQTVMIMAITRELGADADAGSGKLEAGEDDDS